MDYLQLCNTYISLNDLLVKHEGNSKWTEEDLIIAIELLKQFNDLLILIMSSKKVIE